MTAQISETLCFEGRTLRMCDTPLGSYFGFGGRRPKPDFDGFSCTALWRGYVGTWEITHDRLYLVKLKGTLEDGSEAALATVFPDYPDRVFAHWYSGEIRIPEGKLLKYVHMGFGSRYERDLLLTFSNGVLLSRRVRINGHAGPGAPSGGDGVGAMTVFAAPAKRGLA